MFAKILTASDQPALEKFFKSCPDAPIQQTSEWAMVQDALGLNSFRIGVFDQQGDIGIYVQAFIHRLPLGMSWLHIPRGPISNNFQFPISNFQLLLTEIEKLGKEKKAIFVRFDWPEDFPNQKFPNQKLRPAHQTNYPETTLMLDLNLSEEEILAQMKPKGRYNIRVAERHGVTIRETTDPDSTKIFHDLLRKTTARDGFAGHSVDYYRKFLEILTPKKMASCFIAEHAGKPIAAILVTFFGKTAIYYYGASDHEQRNLMAPYAVQWAAIRKAKELGCGAYDFLGIAPDGQTGHSLSGVTDFKKKFGGKVVNYSPASELVLRPAVYAGLKLVKRLRKIVNL